MLNSSLCSPSFLFCLFSLRMILFCSDNTELSDITNLILCFSLSSSSSFPFLSSISSTLPYLIHFTLHSFILHFVLHPFLCFSTCPLFLLSHSSAFPLSLSFLLHFFAFSILSSSSNIAFPLSLALTFLCFLSFF